MARVNETQPSKMVDPKFENRLLDTFRYLCNTDSMNKQLTTQDVNEVRSILKQIQTPLNVNSDPVEEPSSLPNFTDRFQKRLRGVEQEKDELEEDTQNEPNEVESSDKGDDTGDDDRTSVVSSQSRTSGSSRHSSHHQKRRKPETREQTTLKKNYLVILNKLVQEGYTPTQDYTMKDSLQDIKEEIDQYYTCVEATQFVAKRKSNVENGAEWIENGTNIWSVFNPKQPLQLQGLSARIKEVHQSKQVDSDWERIYYTYRRKRMTNPFWGLALAYGSAIISTTVANYATKKLNNMTSTAGGGDGNPLGGVIQSLLGGLMGGGGGSGGGLGGILGGGGGPKFGDMPSMTRDLPTTNGPMPQQGFGPSPPSSPSQTQSIPQPARRFQRKVFFPAV